MVSFHSLCLVALASTAATASNPVATLVTQARRTLNLSRIVGSPSGTAKSPYELIAGHPVFQVTTPWGAPYMNFEQVLNDEKGAEGRKENFDEGSGMRPVALFFMDPDDAVELKDQMKQMSHMEGSDIRITSTTLAKALRQAANLGGGLPTGAPVDPMDGNLKSMNDGGSLRYKIVPPKRQLYYAARCRGKERVGFFSKNAWEDAVSAVQGTAAIGAYNIDRRTDMADRKLAERKLAQMTPEERASAHMCGHSGIPVFYSPEMKRAMPKAKQLTSGAKDEMPFFFSYEDLMDAWGKLRQKNKGANMMPEKPPSVEVFNMWDLLSSMEKDQWKKKRVQKFTVDSLKERFSTKKQKDDLDSITFIPPSQSITFKEQISARGNGKARLRPMR